MLDSVSAVAPAALNPEGKLQAKSASVSKGFAAQGSCVHQIKTSKDCELCRAYCKIKNNPFSKENRLDCKPLFEKSIPQQTPGHHGHGKGSRNGSLGGVGCPATEPAARHVPASRARRGFLQQGALYPGDIIEGCLWQVANLVGLVVEVDIVDDLQTQDT